MVVALVGEDATLKRFYPEGAVVRLQPANPTMQPIRVPAQGRQGAGRGGGADAEVLRGHGRNRDEHETEQQENAFKVLSFSSPCGPWSPGVAVSVRPLYLSPHLL